MNNEGSYVSNKAALRDRILDEIDDVQYRYFVLPHSGLIADWFTHYWELSEMICEYLDEPLIYKPQKSTEDQVK